MDSSAVLMMVIGCGAVWGGALIAIIIALRADKKAGN